MDVGFVTEVARAAARRPVDRYFRPYLVVSIEASDSGRGTVRCWAAKDERRREQRLFGRGRYAGDAVKAAYEANEVGASNPPFELAAAEKVNPLDPRHQAELGLHYLVEISHKTK